ncbi:hypothetical protein HanXRQr2_Chr04g0186891 [Helianthus annuus]|uniref:Uncharacterized protein n=1 Tax=Helianthus annuus TaxID=4232 RepID=A0A9K3JAV8_HELAN|nr:hypothetical protein HanXRQr2_Chr04g0186891 [Helianthus annuus]
MNFIEAGYCTISLNIHYVGDLCLTCDFVILGSPSLSAMRIYTCPGCITCDYGESELFSHANLYMSGFV